MKKTIRNVLKLLGILLLVLMFVFCSQGGSSSGGSSGGGDDDDPPAPLNGTITVNLTNAAAANGHNFVAGIYNDGDDPNVDPAVNGGSDAIDVAGTASFTSISFTGGSNYDVWVFVDLDDSGTGGPNSGDRRNNTAINVSIDGNKTVTVDYATLAVMP